MCNEAKWKIVRQTREPSNVDKWLAGEFLVLFGSAKHYYYDDFWTNSSKKSNKSRCQKFKSVTQTDVSFICYPAMVEN